MANTKRAEALESVVDDQRQQSLEGVPTPVEPPTKATEEQKKAIKSKSKQVGEQPIDYLAGLVTVETGMNQQLIQKLKLSNEDKELVTSALDVLAEVVERKITTESTKRYLGLFLVFIRSALAIE